MLSASLRTFAMTVLGLSILVFPVSAAPIRIYAAGSLNSTLQSLIKASGLPETAFAAPVFGPAGLLRERLTKGETADLFLSADTHQPEVLRQANVKVTVTPFARNRMCLIAKETLGFNATNLLDKMLSPDVRLATSTPIADPGGDYALAVFEKAEMVRPGAASVLTGKALHLLGAPNTMVPVAGHSPAASIFLSNRADALLYYCSASASMQKEVMMQKDVMSLASIPLPETLEVHPIYSMAILTDDPETARFGRFILSQQGQQILAGFGFLPLDAPGR